MNTRDTLKINEKGHLEIGGADCVELAQKFGTPLYALDEAYIRKMMRVYRDTLRKEYGENSLVLYASKAFSCKAKMLSYEHGEEMIGHAVGGVCPFAINENVIVYLDESLKRFETVFPACGSSNSAIELTISELEKHSGATGWIDVCKDWA